LPLVVALFIAHRFIPRRWFSGETITTKTEHNDPKYRDLLNATRVSSIVAGCGTGIFIGLSLLDFSFWKVVWFAAVPDVAMCYFAVASAVRFSELRKERHEVEPK
jgi:hypothetical protein